MKPRTGRSHPATIDLIVSQSRSGRCITEREIERLMDCARKRGRHGHRDATMILAAYRHGLLALEVCHLQWRQIELSQGRLHVRRAKGGIPSVHPIMGDEMRALRQLRRENPSETYVFISERGGPMSPAGFHRLIQRLGEAANIPFPIHPHMLRHACGYKLASDGHDTRAVQRYLGHRSIQSTVRYAELRADRFEDFWRERAHSSPTRGSGIKGDRESAAMIANVDRAKRVKLTDREIEVLTWVARGKTSAEIARKLLVAKRTVDFHIDNARLKLRTATRTEAAIRAASSGLIKP